MSNRTEHRVQDPRHLTRDAHIDCEDRLRARTSRNLLDERVQGKVVLKGAGFPDTPDNVTKLVRILVLLLRFGAVPGQFSAQIVPRRNDSGLSLLGNQARDALCGPRNSHVIMVDSIMHGEIEKLERLPLRSIKEGTTLRYNSDGEHDGEGGGEAADNARPRRDARPNPTKRISVAEQIDTESKSVDSGGDLVNVRQGQFDVRIRQRQEIRLFALSEVWWIVGALTGDMFEETRDLLDDGLGIGTTLGVVGELVVANPSIPRSMAVMHILDGFSVGRSGGLGTKIRDDLLDISQNVNDQAFFGVSLEDISSSGSLYDTTTQANDVLSRVVFEELFQDIGLRLAEGRPAILSDEPFDPDLAWVLPLVGANGESDPERPLEYGPYCHNGRLQVAKLFPTKIIGLSLTSPPLSTPHGCKRFSWKGPIASPARVCSKRGAEAHSPVPFSVVRCKISIIVGQTNTLTHSTASLWMIFVDSTEAWRPHH